MTIILDPKYTLPISSSIVSQVEENTAYSVFGANLTYTLCDRTDNTTSRGNYFSSVNLPNYSGDCSTASTLSMLYPELQQLNVDQIVIIPIPPAYYAEMIRTDSFTIKIPQSGGANMASLSSVTLVSLTYTSDKILRYGENSPLIGSNCCFLFSDSINVPYSGNTINENGILISNSGNTSFNPIPTDFTKRPSATSYLEVKRYLDTYNAASDTRTNAIYSVNLGSSYPDNRSGYNFDSPLGFLIADKGVCVLTSPQLIGRICWTSGYTQTNAAYIENGLAGKEKIYFTGNSNSASIATFQDCSTSFKNTAVCISLPRQHYLSQNSTFDRTSALAAMDNSNNSVVNFPDVYVSSVLLVNALGELISMAKLDTPYKKTYTGLFNTVIDIES